MPFFLPAGDECPGKQVVTQAWGTDGRALPEASEVVKDCPGLWEFPSSESLCLAGIHSLCIIQDEWNKPDNLALRCYNCEQTNPDQKCLEDTNLTILPDFWFSFPHAESINLDILNHDLRKALTLWVLTATSLYNPSMGGILKNTLRWPMGESHFPCLIQWVQGGIFFSTLTLMKQARL